MKNSLEPESSLKNNFSESFNINNKCSLLGGTIIIEPYKDETQMDEIMQVIKNDLSEPYSIYTYRYFIHNWLNLCLLVRINLKKNVL